MTMAMTRANRRAFTLVELMIAIAIICILIALLLPSFGRAWQLAKMTQCQTNLATLFKAHANWNADRDSTDNTLNAGWAGTLQAYLESRTDTLRCPAMADLVDLGLYTNIGDGGGGGSGQAGPSDAPQKYYVAQESPEIELQDITIGVLDASKKLLYEIPLAPSPYWTMYRSWTLPDGRVHIGANVDNDPNPADEDFYFTVEFRGTSPIKVQIGDCDGSANTSYGKWSDFRLDHKPIWNGQVFDNLFAAGHVGEVIDVQKELGKDPGRNSVTGRPPAYATWTIMSTSKTVLGAAGYGLNRGSYQVPYDGPQPPLDPKVPVDQQPPMTARDVVKMDPKLIFILDYPKILADYTDIGDRLADTSFWQEIFIDPTPPPVNWATPPGLDGRTWQACQALRHFGKANVLFCDGHVESLEKSELDPSPNRHRDMWNYQGR
jgi:prepilin-type N-terminal cleavage/methylation domain-containing protein/prepilin-type processing-associated H-X9-DG protein